MWPGKHAAEQPDKPAFVMAKTGDTVTYRELNDRSNQVAQLLWDAGLRFGDHIAILMENRPEYFEICWAAQRSGLFYTVINWHFNADEAAYIIDDCDARVLFISAEYRDLAVQLRDKMPHVELRIMVGDAVVDGYEPYADARDRFPAEPLAEELEGTPMMYSSGTTGRPKGIKYKIKRERVGDMPAQMAMLTAVFGMSGDSVYLSPAPLYHSAPLFYCMSTMRLGGTAIVMEQFDPEDALRYIEQYHVTHSQWVPTMFVRMLKLPPEARTTHDLSSHRCAIHAAAPCPVEIKRQMIEWWGPIIEEYYAATEGTGATYINSEQWLAHPGSVGQVDARAVAHRRRGRQGTSAGRDRHRLLPAHLRPARLRVPQGRCQDRGGVRRARLVDRRRHGLPRRGGLPVPHGPAHVHDRVGRREHLPAGSRERPHQPPDRSTTSRCSASPIPRWVRRCTASCSPCRGTTWAPTSSSELIAYCREHLAHYKCPKIDRLRQGAAAPTDRQALQAAAARPLLGRQDLTHRLETLRGSRRARSR